MKKPKNKTNTPDYEPVSGRMQRLVRLIYRAVWWVDPENPWGYVKKLMVWAVLLQLLAALMTTIAVVLLLQEKQTLNSQPKRAGHIGQPYPSDPLIRGACVQMLQNHPSFADLRSSQAELALHDNRYSQESSEPILRATDPRNNYDGCESSDLGVNSYSYSLSPNVKSHPSTTGSELRRRI